MGGGGVEVASDAAPAGEGGERMPVAGDGLVALGGFRAAFGDVGCPVHGEVAGEQEDLLLILAQPAAQRVAGMVPLVPVPQPVVDDAEGGGVVDAANPARANWKEIIPEADGILKGAGIVDGKILAQYEHNASSQLKLFDLEGKALGDVELPGIGSIDGLGGRWDRKETFFGFQSFTVPPSVYQVDLASRKTSLWDKVATPGIDPSAYEVKQVWYTSKDGTRVPMFVFHKKGIKLDGKNPTMLTGYGGFNVSLTPAFSGGRVSLAGTRRRFRGRQPARWLGVWRRLASRRHAGQKAECFRRLHRRRRIPDRPEIYRQRSPGHPGRIEWRPAHGRHDHAAS